jgi:hypothetical protein
MNRLLMAMALLPTRLVKVAGQRFTSIPTSDPVGLFFEAMYRTGPFWCHRPDHVGNRFSRDRLGDRRHAPVGHLPDPLGAGLLALLLALVAHDLVVRGRPHPVTLWGVPRLFVSLLFFGFVVPGAAIGRSIVRALG